MKKVNIRQLENKPSTPLAVSLFRSGAVSAGFAARMADKVLGDMLTLLSSQGIPLTGNDKAEADEAAAEMRVARDWLVKPAM